jgi:imidazolonepropionase-like amidohydrolase
MTGLSAWLLLALAAAACGVTTDVTPERRSQTIALVGGRVQASPETPAIQDGVVLIDGAAITAVGERMAVRVPSGATVIDCAGATVMAGF